MLLSTNCPDARRSSDRQKVAAETASQSAHLAAARQSPNFEEGLNLMDKSRSVEGMTISLASPFQQPEGCPSSSKFEMSPNHQRTGQTPKSASSSTATGLVIFSRRRSGWISRARFRLARSGCASQCPRKVTALCIVSWFAR